MRVAEAITLSPDERIILDRWTTGRSFPFRVVQRAQIIRMAADGVLSRVIARTLRISRPTVQLWRQRFLALRLPGLEKDAPRPGRIPRISHRKVSAVIHATLHSTPPNATHWSARSLAKAQGLSKDAIHRIWKQYNWKPHLIETFQLSGDCMPRHRHQELIRFLQLINVQTPLDLDLHLIVDNYGTHKHPRVHSWLKRHPRFHLHCIPTSSSWLHLVERWFREITDQRIRRGSFQNVASLVAAIQQYIDTHNQNPKVFIWSAPAERIMSKIAKCKEALETLH